MSARPTRRNLDLTHIVVFAVTLASIALVATAAGPVQAGSRSVLSAAASPKPGSWTRLGLAQGGGTVALVHVANGTDLAVWTAPSVSANNYYYYYAELKPHGGMVSSPKSVFGGRHWDGITFFPVLLSQGGKGLLIFQGGRTANSSTDPYSRGCIVGDLLTPTGWTLQKWSLSAVCMADDHLGATITRNGTLSAAWPGGWANGGVGIRYRIGVSPTIPATPDDQHLSTVPGAAGEAAETTETRSQDIYAAWDRFFSNPASKDGIWAADLSKKPRPLKAPDSGTNTSAHEYYPVALASPTVRGGVYLAYCNNANSCSQVEFWRYGAKNARRVPGSSSPASVSLSAGPSGRLWIAWWSAENGTVRVVRTNEAGTRFGPVETYTGPRGCQGDGNGHVKISGGSQQRADVALECYGLVSGNVSKTEIMATQSLAPLQIRGPLITGSVKQKKGESVTYRVSDVGDPVAGATVTLYGAKGSTKKGVTDKKGQTTFHFVKGSKPASFRVVASKGDYLNATTSLHIA